MKTLEEIVIEVFRETCIMDDIIPNKYTECHECKLRPVCRKLSEMECD